MENLLTLKNSDIFGPKVQFMSFNSKTIKIHEKASKKRDIPTLSNEQEVKNNSLPASDQKVKKAVKNIIIYNIFIN